MIRVLHLISDKADDQARRLSALLARLVAPAAVVETRRIGRGGDHRSPLGAAASLRRDGWSFDVVHAWDGPSLAAASLGGVARPVFSPSAAAPLGRGLLGRVFPPKGLQVVCSTADQRSAYLRAGYEAARSHVILPAAVPSDVGREAVRSRLGLSAADCVVLAPGESTRAANHELAVWVGSILRIIDERYRILIAGDGPQVAKVRRLAGALRRPGLLVCAKDLAPGITPAALAAAADVALLTTTTRVAPLPVVDCLAAGLPIVTAPGPTASALLRDDHDAAVAPTATAPAVAKRLLEVDGDPQLRGRLGRQARATAEQSFAVAAFVRAYAGLYRRVADGEPARTASVDPAFLPSN